MNFSHDYVSLGEEGIIASGSVLTVNIDISDFVYINTSCVISHDTRIGMYSTLCLQYKSHQDVIKGIECIYVMEQKLIIIVEIKNSTKIATGSVLVKNN